MYFIFVKVYEGGFAGVFIDGDESESLSYLFYGCDFTKAFLYEISILLFSSFNVFVKIKEETNTDEAIQHVWQLGKFHNHKESVISHKPNSRSVLGI